MSLIKKTIIILTTISIFMTNCFAYAPLNIISISSFTANALDIVDSGICGAKGDNLSWMLGSDGTLVISGNGDMMNWEFGESPWYGNMRRIKNVVLANGVTSIGDYAFEGCYALTLITIPYSVTSIGNEAFRCCFDLTSVAIPDSVTSIGDYAFYGCTSLTSITLPDSIASIGNEAFSECEALTSVTIPDSVTNIEYTSFINTPWLEAQRNKNPLVIVNGILIDGTICEGNITVPNDVKSIGNGAFSECKALTSVIIPNSVTNIGDKAFYSCDALTSITLPDSVTSIGNEAFGYSDSLKSITIENTECVIYDSEDTICNYINLENGKIVFTGTINGYIDSTAQIYAEKYNIDFVSLGKSTSSEKSEKAIVMFIIFVVIFVCSGTLTFIIFRIKKGNKKN